MSIWVVLDLCNQFNEHDSSQPVSQQNVADLEFGSPMFTSFNIVCSWPDSSRFTTGCTVLSWIVSPHSIMNCFVSNVNLYLHERDAFGNRLTHYMSDSLPRVAPFNQVWQLLHGKNVFRSPENGTFSPTWRDLGVGRFQQRIAPLYSWSGFGIGGLGWDFRRIVVQLVLLVVEHLVNSILFSNHASKRS